MHRSHGERYNRGKFFPPVLCESLPLFSGLISRATRLFFNCLPDIRRDRKNEEARMFLYGYFYTIESAYVNIRAYYVRMYLPAKINCEILF